MNYAENDKTLFFEVFTSKGKNSWTLAYKKWWYFWWVFDSLAFENPKSKLSKVFIIYFIP